MNEIYSEAISMNKSYDKCVDLAKRGKLPDYEFEFGDEPCLVCRYYKGNKVCGYEDGLGCLIDDDKLKKYSARMAFKSFMSAETSYSINHLLYLYDEFWTSTAGYEYTEFRDGCGINVDDFLDWINDISELKLGLIEAVCTELGWGLEKLEEVLGYFNCSIYSFAEAIDDGFLVGGNEYPYSDSLDFLDKFATKGRALEDAKKEWNQYLSDREEL